MCRRQGVIATDADQREKMFRQAEASYQRILSMDPTDGRAYVGLGRLLEIERRYDDARRLLEDGCAVAGRSFNSLSLRTSHDRGNLPRRGGQSVPVDGAGEPGGEGESARRSAEQLRGRHHGGSVRLFVFCRRWTEAPKCRSHEAAWHAWGELEKRDGNYQLAKDCWMKGIRHARGTPSPYLFLSLARLATDLGLYDQARHWFRCVPSRRGDSATGSLRTGTGTARGSKSYVLWTAWALLEQKQGQTQLMRRLFEQSLKVRARSIVPRDALCGGQLGPKGRYVYLSWGCIEQKEGRLEEARKLFLRSADASTRSAY